MRLVFAHYNKTKNLGDLLSAPHLYPELAFPGAQVSEWNARSLAALNPNAFDAVIIGGGAIANSVRLLPQGRAKVIGWGVGTTKHGITRRVPTAHRARYDILGVREWKPVEGEAYVPCASCFHPDLRTAHGAPKTREVVLFTNEDAGRRSRTIIPHEWASVPRLHNHHSAKDVFPFLASAEVVITTSYHGAYWGQLLGARVVLWQPYSSKFYGFKNRVGLAFNPGMWASEAEKVRPARHALADAMSANRNFRRAVGTYLEAHR